MTIASAFNDIAVAQGGTASKSGSIASAIDALNDALAGSDQPAAQTIEDAVTLLGNHIGRGGGEEAHLYLLFQDAESAASKTWHIEQNGHALAEGEMFEFGGSYYVVPVEGAVAGNVKYVANEGETIDYNDYTAWQMLYYEYPFADDKPDPLLDWNFYQEQSQLAFAYMYTTLGIFPYVP